MAMATDEMPLVLIGGAADPDLAQQLQAHRCGVVQVPTGGRVIEWARDIRPDVIVVHDHLPDMTAMDACELLRRDPRIGHNVPILILASDRPTPGQRVAAVSAGAWDFVRYPGEPKELSIKLQSYLQAKRNLDLALADGLIDPLTGLHNRVGLARRARELGALMSRRHGGLGCLVFSLEAEVPDLEVGTMIVRSTRVSDVVGSLSPKELAVLAPGTDEPGMVRLALRVGGTLSTSIGGRTPFVPGSTLRAGYDAVANVTYSPVDPVELLGRASAAVRNGKPEAGSTWVRRYEDASGDGRSGGWTSPESPLTVAPERRGAGV